jgi:alpha-tubulin suppressor-like RCC1 family protein/uncharacterized protein YjdB
MRRRVAAGLLMGAALLPLSCDSSTAPEVQISAVEIVAPASTSISIGDTMRLSAIARDARGTTLAIVRVAWSSGRPEVATVDSTGRVVGVGEGRVGITASVDDHEALVQLTIFAPISDVSVTPHEVGLRVGASRQLSAALTDRAGDPVTGGRLDWRSRNPQVAAVDSTGMVTSLALGTTTIIASVGGLADSARVVVSGPPASVRIAPDSIDVLQGSIQRLVAHVEDANGNAVLGVPLRWTSEDPAIVAIDSAGTVRAIAIGLGRVSVTADSVHATGIVNVVSASIARVALWPDTVLVQRGRTRSLQPLFLGPTGFSVPPAPASWTSSDTRVATVDQNGVVSGGSPGQAVIRVRAAGRAGEALVNVVEYPEPLVFQSVEAGETMGCALTTAGRAYCWGDSRYGQLGTTEALERCGGPPDPNRNDPTSYRCASLPRAVAGDLTFTTLSVGSTHVCGLVEDRTAYCWGLNSYGELGTGTTQSSPIPVAVSGGVRFRSIDVGAYHTCGISQVGVSYCWGYNSFAQLGTGSLGTFLAPTPVAADTGFALLRAGGLHSCGLTIDGAAYCWGRNGDVELGARTSTDQCGRIPCATKPIPVEGSLSFRDISPGTSFTCALTLDGKPYCWGSGNYLGGIPATEACPISGFCADEPAPVPTTARLTSLGTGPSGDTCGLGAEGSVFCWGRNPVEQVQGIPPLRSFSFNGIACGMGTDGIAYCWGSTYAGQLGNGVVGNSSGGPSPVAGQR